MCWYTAESVPLFLVFDRLRLVPAINGKSPSVHIYIFVVVDNPPASEKKEKTENPLIEHFCTTLFGFVSTTTILAYGEEKKTLHE